jgi:hypothetical protein
MTKFTSGSVGTGQKDGKMSRHVIRPGGRGVKSFFSRRATRYLLTERGNQVSELAVFYLQGGDME